MKSVIALHGNPGTALDWNHLRGPLEKEHFDLRAFDAYGDEWIQALREGSDKKILLAFSWGCYRALSKAKELSSHIEKLVLVAPSVHVERPLSGLAAAVLKTPLVGDGLLKSNHAKSIEGFMTDMLSPAEPASTPAFQDTRKRLREDWTLWKKAAFAKIQQQQNPLGPQHGCALPGWILWGQEDKVGQQKNQAQVLQHFPGLQWRTLEKQGHGLPWTAGLAILEALKSTPTTASTSHSGKIGYFPGEEARNNVMTYMEKHLKEHPERIALRWAKREALASWNGDPKTPIAHDQIDYKNFAARINSFAKGLQEIGIQKGDRVIIFLPMSLDMYTSMFAVQKIGAIAVFLDSWARSHHLGASAACAQPKAMISFHQAYQIVNQVPEFKSMPIRILYGPGDTGTHDFTSLMKPAPTPTEAVESEFTALITFTTGSTGTPKGANRTHRFLSAQHHALNHVIPYTEKDADMPAFPIFSLNNLAAGVTTVLPALDLAAPSPRDPALLACQILNENITCTTLSPSMLVGLARYCQENQIQLRGLRRVVTGGAPISKDDVRNFYAIAPQTDLWILYGSTEAEPMAHIEGREMLKNEPSDPEIVENGVNVGHISEDVDFKFIRIVKGPIDLKKTPWSAIEVPRGEVGEFLVTGDHVCRDYYNNPEAFLSTKIMGEDGRVWHRTGDLAALDEQGLLWIVGRVNNAVERGGKYYFPVRSEVLLKRFPFAVRGAFLGLPDEKLGERNVGVLELKSDLDPQTFDFEAARRELRRVFEKNSIPLDEIRFVKSIPMDPRHHSKVEYALLRKQLLENAHEALG